MLSVQQFLCCAGRKRIRKIDETKAESTTVSGGKAEVLGEIKKTVMIRVNKWLINKLYLISSLLKKFLSSRSFHSNYVPTTGIADIRVEAFTCLNIYSSQLCNPSRPQSLLRCNVPRNRILIR